MSQPLEEDDKRHKNTIGIVVHGAGSVSVGSDEESLDKVYKVADEVIRNMLGVLKGTDEEFEAKKKRHGIG